MKRVQSVMNYAARLQPVQLCQQWRDRCSGGSKNFESVGEDNWSVPSSFIAKAHNEKGRFFEPITPPPTPSPWIRHWRDAVVPRCRKHKRTSRIYHRLHPLGQMGWNTSQRARYHSPTAAGRETTPRCAYSLPVFSSPRHLDFSDLGHMVIWSYPVVKVYICEPRNYINYGALTTECGAPKCNVGAAESNAGPK